MAPWSYARPKSGLGLRFGFGVSSVFEGGGMKKRRTKIIKDKKKRGEWAESVFIARAGEEGLAASKPWGDSRSYDCVVGRPGKFVAVQVKCTIARLESGEGYICSVCSSHKPYPPGSFDFVAAYVILEDAWYIIPEREIRGLKSISLCTVGGEAKYEHYREAWSLLRKASEIGDPESSAPQSAPEQNAVAPPTSAVGRMATAASYFKRYLERNNIAPGKTEETS
jgi:hypothetical protein